MTYYGITSSNISEKVFAVIAITLFIAWLVNPLIFGDTFFEDEDAQSKNLNIRKTAILLIFISLGTSFIVFSRTTSNLIENFINFKNKKYSKGVSKLFQKWYNITKKKETRKC